MMKFLRWISTLWMPVVARLSRWLSALWVFGVIWLCSLHHLTWAYCLATAADPHNNPGKVTGIKHLTLLFESGGLSLNLLVVWLFAISVMAIAGTALTGKWKALGMYLAFAQQMTLFASAYGAYTAAIAGQYADGTLCPQRHITADQDLHVWLALLHFATLIGQHSGRDKEASE